MKAIKDSEIISLKEVACYQCKIYASMWLIQKVPNYFRHYV